MNAYLLSAAAILGSLLSITGAAVIQAQPDTLDKTYTNAKCGITIKYPSSWPAEEQKKGPDDEMRRVVMFFNDESSDSIDITADDMSSLLGTSYEQSLDGIVKFSTEFIEETPGASIEESKSMTVNGQPAHRIVYIETTPGSELESKTAETYFFSGDKQHYYILTLSASTDTYDKEIPVFDSMIQSVSLGDVKNC